MEKDDSRRILNALKALSDGTRLRIVHILSYSALSVNEIVKVLSMGQSRVSRHLKILSDAGILSAQREGTWVYYRPSAEKSSFPAKLSDLILEYRETVSSGFNDEEKVQDILKERAEKRNEFFNRIGSSWEKVQKEVLNPDVYAERILSLVPKSSGLLVDLGCGPGTMIRHLQKRSERIIGFDSSEKMIESSREFFKGQKKISFEVGSADRIPLKAETADTVIASMVLHHVSNPALALQEAARVLKKKGILCIVDLMKHDREFMRDRFADLWLGFEPELLKDWLIHAGFAVEKMEVSDTDTDFKIITIKAGKGGHHVPRNKNSRL
ncbi:MAG TPA: metalloregulator ArsR/SmtB family transcription factor [Leptospiraceae bacterium]|nr:metalloregulator ArsR/SmtB family transcription factor [Leptospiraceae bacterium]HMZ60872.1 metalloregulator ArsR/SmtB family transcription factor [Leptospiraceae bacterium]HNI27734.1 metalloregulator ArsR/SmtB family transcription factor [Leptospiraceae bacterium]HNI98066.1 metalloregulator ArsR/SmtB family transcription factor [Leptospiraceae bacterium]HNM04760.1 metalloregulator ArsR/SmtB family transcription factor [Leptospiraceae bacterium]